MTTYRIVQRGNKAVRFDLPEFATIQEGHDFITLELWDGDFLNHYLTPIEN